MQRAKLNFALHRKQLDALNSPATEILFGGAAGPGKSHLLRVAAIVFAFAIQGLQVYLFRRTRPDLWKNHVEGPSGLLALLAPAVAAGKCKFNLSENRIELGQSRIFLCHCEHETDVYKYQGAEIHLLLPDELTHFTASQYGFLRSRVRMVGITLPPQFAGRFPRVIAATNPGNVGHNWVKAAFVNAPVPPMAVWQTPKSEGGMLRQFIPAFLSDNPSLTREDPDYKDRLSGLNDEALVKAMLDGDWNIVAGGALDDLWKQDRHVIPPFEIPKSWRIDRSFDWGSSKPFSVGWWAESNGEDFEAAGVKRCVPKGTLFRVAELYGWNGKPNEGCRKIATEIAREILEFEKAKGWAGRVVPGPADSAIFAVENGTSIASDMSRMGVRWIEAEKGPGSRANGLERVRQYLKASLASPMESPGIFFFDTCRDAIRTLPTLPRDQRKPDDVDTASEDHCYDEVRYRVSAEKLSAPLQLSTIPLIGV